MQVKVTAVIIRLGGGRFPCSRFRRHVVISAVISVAGHLRLCGIKTQIYYLVQQTLKPDDDYVLPHQRLWTMDP